MAVAKKQPLFYAIFQVVKNMSSNIKGITIEIGGNTGPLTSALKDVNKTSRDLQGELKEVNKQLKFDPNNTVLLKQKQDLLAQSITNSKDKLATLKEAEKQFQKQVESGDYGKKQIDSAESSLNKVNKQLLDGVGDTKALKEQQKDLQKALADLQAQAKAGTLGEDKLRALQRETSNAESKLKDLEKQAKETSDSFGLLGEKAGKINSAMATAGTAVAGGIVATGAYAVKTASDYEDSLAKVSTIADTSKKSIQDLSGEVINISNETGASADEINEALYQAISAGADTAKATGLVETAVKAAKGGFTDTTTAVDGLTSVLNTYGMKTEDANQLANQFLITQNLGKTTFGELAQSIGQVAPTASAAGVKTNELLSSIASLTANGIDTSQAVTGMKAALSNIIKPTSDASGLAQKLGIDFSASALQTQGLSGFMETLKEKTGGNIDTMSQLFGSTEALNTVLTLTSDSGMGTMNKTMQEMQTNTTAVDDAYGKIKSTTSGTWEDTTNEAKNLAIQLGEKLKPAVDKILDLVKWLIENKESVIGTLAAIAAGLAAFNVVVMIQNVIKAFNAWKAATEGMTIAQRLLNLAMSANPVGIIVAVIAVLVTAIIYLWNTNEGFRNAVMNIWNGIKNFFAGIPGFFSGLWNGIRDTAVNAWNALIGFFTGLPGTIGNIMNSIGSWVRGVWDDLIGFIGSVPGRFLSGLSGIEGAVRGAFDGAISFITGLPGEALQWGKDIIDGIVNGIKNAASAVGDAVSGVAQDIRSFLHFSVPDQGPLVDYESWMPDMMAGMASGITNNVGKLKTAAMSAASAISSGLSLNANLTPAYAGSTAASPTTQRVEHSGTITVKGVNDSSQISGVVDIIIDQLRKEIRT